VAASGEADSVRSGGPIEWAIGNIGFVPEEDESVWNIVK
jgi:hypothetical protein